MSGSSRGRIAIGAAISSLYGYVLCMLASNALLNSPLFGGAVYLNGRAVTVLTALYKKSNRSLLPRYSRIWIIFLSAVLSLFVLALNLFCPISFDNPLIWLVLVFCFLCIFSEMTVTKLGINHSANNPSGRRTHILLIVSELFLSLIVFFYMFFTMSVPMASLLTACFALRIILQFYTEKQMSLFFVEKPHSETIENEDIFSLRAYSSFSVISLLLACSFELTMALIFSLLAAGTQHILPAIGIGTLMTIVSSELGMAFVYRTGRGDKREPAAILLLGVSLWVLGLLVCIRYLSRGPVSVGKMCLPLSLCCIGSAFGFIGLGRLEELIPSIAAVAGKKMPDNYLKTRKINWDLSLLMGDVIALAVLAVFFFTQGTMMPGVAGQSSFRLQPLMILPPLLVTCATLVCIMRFPISYSYFKKLRRLIGLSEKGEDNPALRKQLEKVTREGFQQPFFARAIILIIKIFYRHKLVNTDHIEEDPDNPIVFLCNHAEIYGPVICETYIPVSVRPWVISTMMTDRKEVTDYLYTNNFSGMRHVPESFKKMISRLAGTLSVTLMNQVEAIPVYRDQPAKLRDTIRQSVSAMEAGDNLLIFPENSGEKYASEGINHFSPGFVMLALAYLKKTGKRMRLLPLYANSKNRTITFGTIITFDDQVPFPDEQKRIITEAERQINEIAGIC